MDYTACGSVQNKVSCLFRTISLEEPSKKRSYQAYRVIASDEIKEVAHDHDLEKALVTEKLDGTCVYAQEFRGKPWLWARLDRKPNKLAEKQLRKVQANQRLWEKEGKMGPRPDITWDVLKDFKAVPIDWIPATGVDIVNDIPQPDQNGHIPGWVPLDPSSRQHCWHLTTVDLENGIALVLRHINKHGAQQERMLQISLVPLAEIARHTLELIGTNINGNPYGLGCKQHPLHLLVVHGSIHCHSPPKPDHKSIMDWFSSCSEGRIEGIVWHCKDGQLFKLHRHHLGLEWPVENLHLNSLPVKIDIDLSQYELECDHTSQIRKLAKLDGQTVPHLNDLLKDGVTGQ
ncbi:RNA ligase 1-like [Lineus longissimus]|uniref:RNA ligase 1-like n=1 Tax=Lineus longissimus TaxID=88925 RepID=UPI002B4E6B7F